MSGVAALVLAWAAPAGASAQQTAAAAIAPLVFDGVTVVDVEQGKLVPDQRVVIAGNRIQAMGSSVAVKPPSDAQVVDARGKYLIPGLWDLHAHTTYGGASWLPKLMVDSAHKAELSHLLLIANGVTGVRDPGSSFTPLDTLVRWRREILAGTRVGPPRQILSGVMISDHGEDACFEQNARFWGNGFAGHVCVHPDSAEIAQRVHSLKVAGADMVKMYGLQPKTYFLLAAAARREGLRFGGHASSQDMAPVDVSPLDIADSGASIVDHIGDTNAGILDSLCFNQVLATVAGCRVVAERWRRTNTWSVPTLIVEGESFFLTDSSQTTPQLLLKALRDFWGSFTYDPTWLHGHIPAETAPLKVARNAGLPILAGTDWGMQGAGFSLHAELALMTDLGMTPLAALQAATLNPAKMLGATDSLGTVAPGKLADLVLLDANPLAEISNTAAIRAVVANGRYYDRAALDGLLAKVHANVKQNP